MMQNFIQCLSLPASSQTCLMSFAMSIRSMFSLCITCKSQKKEPRVFSITKNEKSLVIGSVFLLYIRIIKKLKECSQKRLLL